MFKNGLVAGKFSPLHLGHEHLIRTAMAGTDHLSILSYSKPEFEGCQARVREQWLTGRFPRAEVLVLDDQRLSAMAQLRGLHFWPTIPTNSEEDDVHDAFIGWVCINLLGRTFDAVFTSEDYGDRFAANLTQYFFKHDQRCVVSHVSVDQTRTAVPISATRIRSDPSGLASFLAPEVRRTYFVG